MEGDEVTVNLVFVTDSEGRVVFLMKRFLQKRFGTEPAGSGAVASGMSETQGWYQNVPTASLP